MAEITVRDLIAQEVDIDVYDDVTEELGIAFCGPLKLTTAGEEKFSEVLGYKVELKSVAVAIIKVDAPEGEWQKRLRKAKEFFEAAAGYCLDTDYQKWFED